MYTPNQEIEQYLQQIEAAIYHLAQSDGFIDGLRQQLYDYAEVHTILSISALVEEFGTPEEVAADFLETCSALKPKKIAKSRKRGWLKTAIILALVAIVIGEMLHLHDLKRHTQVMATDVIIIHDNEENADDDVIEE